MSSPQDLAKVALIALAEGHGKGFRRAAYEPVEGPASLLGDEHTDCWTHAWEDGRTYVEGRVILNGRRVAHAWVLDADGNAVEVTPGYEAARSYIGLVLNRPFAEEATALWEGPRSSIVGTAYVALDGLPTDLVVPQP